MIVLLRFYLLCISVLWTYIWYMVMKSDASCYLWPATQSSPSIRLPFWVLIAVRGAGSLWSRWVHFRLTEECELQSKEQKTCSHRTEFCQDPFRSRQLSPFLSTHYAPVEIPEDCSKNLAGPKMGHLSSRSAWPVFFIPGLCFLSFFVLIYF